MKLSIPALTLLLLATPVFAQTTGTSHPEALNDNIVVAPPPAQVAPAPLPPPAPELQPRIVEQPAPVQRQTADAYQPALRTPDGRPADNDPDAGIVTTVPHYDNALAEGTVIRARLVGELSTANTKQGSHFVATLSRNVEHDGSVILPVGATIEGRISEVRGGHRLGSAAAIHLVPETVTLPDGTLYRLDAQLIDLDAGRNTRVNSEGAVVGNDHTAGHLTTLGATTGGGAIAGAILGGGPGLLIGAGVGAGVGTVIWLRQDRQQTLPEGTELVFSLNRPMEITPTAPLRN
ncbi:MAG TPA: hypothetical protein VIJ79_00635 [Acidobacteriaceae bacterium]